MKIQSNGDWVSSGTLPTFTSCGTGSPTLTAKSTNNSGSGTMGAGASLTACTVTFANSGWVNAPNCIGTTNTTLTPLYVSAVSTSSVTFTTSATTLGGDKLYYICQGNE